MELNLEHAWMNRWHRLTNRSEIEVAARNSRPLIGAWCCWRATARRPARTMRQGVSGALIGIRLTLLSRSQDRLRQESIASGQGERFEALEPTLVGERTAIPYHQWAAHFGVTESAIKSMVLRLRRRFRDLLREEVAQTIGDAKDV